MSFVISYFSYLPECCRATRVYAGRFFSSPVQPCPSYFLRGCRFLFSWCVHTGLIFSASGMLIFGILWHHLVWPGFWHGPFWVNPLSIVASSFPLHGICSRLSFWLPNTLLHMSLLIWTLFYTPCLSAWWVSHSTPVTCFHFIQFISQRCYYISHDTCISN